MIGFFDWNKKQYLKISVDQQVEVASLGLGWTISLPRENHPLMLTKAEACPAL